MKADYRYEDIVLFFYVYSLFNKLICNIYIMDSVNKCGKKGENGCILIIGGSDIYTGAPLFTALGALRSGSEIVYLMTESRNNLPLKSLLEVIVLPLEYNSRILKKISCCVIGPGLGRLPKQSIQRIKKIVKYLNNKKIPFVIDADGIHYYKKGIFNQINKLVITPNYLEAIDLNLKYSHCCLYKNQIDTVVFKNRKIIVDLKGNPKRISGQGDILSGILATYLSTKKAPIYKTCVKAAKLIRKVSYLAFKRYGMSLITSDIFKFFRKIKTKDTARDHL